MRFYLQTQNTDFLKTTLIHFQDPKLGVVQTRWGFINRNYSLLTNLQTLALDAHFTIEQGARNRFGHFINFNGTGGVWRKECILEGGNWSPDTLTEDLDLSYRAQFKGWKFKITEARNYVWTERCHEHLSTSTLLESAGES